MELKLDFKARESRWIDGNSPMKKTMKTQRGAAIPGPRKAPRPIARPNDAAEALAWLKAGNRRFVSGKLRHGHEAASWRAHLQQGQQPFATILACSDSRVPPELVFDQGFGDLFVIRVAGNVISTDVVASIQYAILHLKTPLVVVMGHECCGAVTAAVDAMAGRSEEPRFIAALLASIQPGLKKLPSNLEGDERIHAAVEANVHWSMRQLRALPEAKQSAKRKTAALIGAVYDIATGKVRFLDQS